MEKKGIGHLEVILSFLIFIAAVGFALYFFSPTHTSRLVDSSLSYAISEIKENISSDIEVYSVKINNAGNRINNNNNFVAINLNKTNGNVRVINALGAVLPSRMSLINENEMIVYFNNSGSIWPESSLVKVFVSDNYAAYNPVPSVNVDVNSSFYELASVDNKEIYGEGNVLELNRSYWQNYSLLKKEFNLNGLDFGFSIKFSNGDEINSKKEVQRGLDVFSDSEKIEILRNNGEIDYADLVVQIW